MNLRTMTAGFCWPAAGIAAVLLVTANTPVAALEDTVSAPTYATAAMTVAMADDGARVTTEHWIRPGRELDLVVDSPALEADADVRLLLPEGWSATSKRRWPVLYLLHGCCDADGYSVWTRMTDVEQLVAERDVIVVMPSAGWAGFYSNWRNHGAGGAPRWEDFHLNELRQILERGYRAGPRRAVAGLSMGGFGALSYAARHPKMFVAAASFSGVVHTLMDWRGPALTSGLVLSGGSDPTAIWGDPLLGRRTWAAHNPFDLVSSLRDLPIYLSSGNGRPGPLDPTGTLVDPLETPIGDMNRLVADRLRAAGADITSHLYGPGTHTWPYWQRELRRALPLLMKELKA